MIDYIIIEYIQYYDNNVRVMLVSLLRAAASVLKLACSPRSDVVDVVAVD